MMNVQEESAFMFDYPIPSTRAEHGSQDHTWNGELLRGYAEASLEIMQGPSRTNGGRPSWSGPGTQFASSPHP
jgi:hypothetical protein